ncbi:MAG: CsbD family protein [Cyanobacteriota bacterium]
MEILAKQLAKFLKISTVKLLAGLICLAAWMLMPLPAAAIINNHAITPQILATIAQKIDAKAKETEGKVQSAYGELTGKPSEQIKGKVKQVQGSAKGTQQDIKQGAKSIAEKVSDAAGNMADSLN